MNKNDAKSLLADEVERIVENSARCGGIVRAGYHAGVLADTYPMRGFHQPYHRCNSDGG